MLVPYSDQKHNYHHFSKSLSVTVLYHPVWEEVEIREFLDSFEEHRAYYAAMYVPKYDQAMLLFDMLGGVPRYVLGTRQTPRRLRDLESALRELDKDTCLEFLASHFGRGPQRDLLVHIKCGLSMDNSYQSMTFCLASNRVKQRLIQSFHTYNKAGVVDFLRRYANSSDADSVLGSVFELVAHALFKVGGSFRMKRVLQGCDSKDAQVETLEVSKQMKVVIFYSLKDLPGALEPNTYYQPRASNLTSIAAIMYPNYLVQYFSYNSASHGYVVNGYVVKGLEEVHAVLGLSQYKVCSCVPEEKFEKCGFQPWLTTAKTIYKLPPQFIQDSEQWVIEVDYIKFGDQ